MRRVRLIAEAQRLLEDAELCGDRDAEMTLFKALHACRVELDRSTNGDSEDLARLTELKKRIAERLVNDNLGLVYEMRRRTGLRDGDEDEYFSTGLWVLHQAVLQFDPWRGNRFSTYACNALLRGYWHVRKGIMRRRQRLQEYMDQPLALSVDDTRHDPMSELGDRLRLALQSNAAGLTEAERFVIERRFLAANGRKRDPLHLVGRMLNRSKERVRQIQISALEKLRHALARDPVVRSLLWSN